MRPAGGFTREVPKYTVLELTLENYVNKHRHLPNSYEFLSGPMTLANKFREIQLLMPHFVLWPKPLLGRLAGFREDSRVFLLYSGVLVAGVYLCLENDLDRKGWGQLHYAFIDEAHKGKGLYSSIFQEAVEKAQEWGLLGLVLDSDRYQLPEVYERWGATPLSERPKKLLRHIIGSSYRMLFLCLAKAGSIARPKVRG